MLAAMTTAEAGHAPVGSAEERFMATGECRATSAHRSHSMSRARERRFDCEPHRAGIPNDCPGRRFALKETTCKRCCVKFDPMNLLPRSARALTPLKDAFATRFRQFVSAPRFPCVGAKSAMNRNRVAFGLYEQMADPGDAAQLCDALADFSRQYPAPGADPVSFVAMFRQPVANEDDFHDRLWTHLQVMHDLDATRHAWDDTVSADVDDPTFSFSIASRAFFVVGLHPQASRLARRAPFPCLVFNFHDQFEALRSNGRYAKLQEAIRARDIALQGDINPVLASFGDASEARQYSGRARAEASAHPFRARRAS